MEAENYITIDYELIKEEIQLPFNLYLYNPSNHNICPFLHATYEFDDDLKGYLETLLAKGAYLRIPKSQIQSYLDFTGTDEDIFKSSLEEFKHVLDEEQDEKVELATINDQELIDEYGEFIFSKVIVDGSKDDDYSYLYKKARNEILMFSLHYTHTVSLAIYLADHLMKTDNFNNRVVATAYFIAKGMGIYNQREFSDIIVASFIHHIGNTHFPIMINSKEQTELDSSEEKEWKMHPKYAVKFLDKMDLQVSDRCKEIIKCHHQRDNGAGFPDWEGDLEMDPFAQIVGLSSFLWEYAMGKIDGKKRSMKAALYDFKHKETGPNIDREYCKALKNFIYSIDLSETQEKITKIQSDDVYENQRTGTDDY